VIDLFSTGGGKKAAEEFEVPILGAIPLDLEVGALGDVGVFCGSSDRGRRLQEDGRPTLWKVTRG
jgi:hypothetical protein